MNRNSIKDNELENVNGGNQQELIDLADWLGQQTLNVGAIEQFLKYHGIKACLYDDQTIHNLYFNEETGQYIKHDELMEMIKKNRWHM